MSFLRSQLVRNLFSLRTVSGGRKQSINVPPAGICCGSHNNVLNSDHCGVYGGFSRCYGTLRALVSPTMTSFLFRFKNSIVSTNAEEVVPGGPFSIQSRGMKYKGKVNRRCKDCKLVWVNGMLYNLCSTHRRHKHGLKQPLYENQKILTHATTSPKRPW